MLNGQATLGQLPTLGANTVLGSSAGTNAPLTLPAGCAAINWVTNTGFSCAAINPVNILSLGADNTGTNDDSAIISSALNSGKPIYFPGGIYKMNSAVTVSPTANSSFVMFGDGEDATAFLVASGQNWLTLNMAGQNA